MIGGSRGRSVIKFDAKSKDGGKTLEGWITYDGEGPIHFKAAKK